MKKTLALFLTLALCVILLPAGAETHEFSYGETVEIRKDQDGNTLDLGGIEVIIGDWWSGEPPPPASAAEEATEEYREWIQETYNFKIKQAAVSSWADNPNFLVEFATTGGPENYVLIMRSDVLAAPMTNGLLYDLSTIKSVDFSKEKWNESTREIMSKGDSFYGMRNTPSDPRDGVWFNKRMLEEVGVNPESLYDMQKDGTWTWEAFEEICTKLTRDTNNDGVIDVYAIASQELNAFSSALASNGAAFVKKDENGKYYDATNEDAFLEAANWMVKISTTYEMPQPEGANWDWSFAAFYNGDVAMTIHQDYFKGQLTTSMTDEYGFVMFPVGPRGDTYKNVYYDHVFVIPAVYEADRAEKIALAFDLYTEPTPGYDDPDAWKSSNYQYFTDARAVDETLQMMRQPEHGTIWLSDLVPGYSLGEQFYWPCYGYNAWMTPSECLETSRPIWQAALDAVNK